MNNSRVGANNNSTYLCESFDCTVPRGSPWITGNLIYLQSYWTDYMQHPAVLNEIIMLDVCSVVKSEKKQNNSLSFKRQSSLLFHFCITQFKSTFRTYFRAIIYDRTRKKWSMWKKNESFVFFSLLLLCLCICGMNIVAHISSSTFCDINLKFDWSNCQQ